MKAEAAASHYLNHFGVLSDRTKVAFALLTFAHLTFALLSHSHCCLFRTVGIRTSGFALVSFALLSFALLSGYRPTFPSNFVIKFSQKMPPYPLLYDGAKKSKMTKNSNQGGSCLKLDLGELENHLWAHVESKISKKFLPGNIRARMARNWTVLSIGRVVYHAFIHHFISSYAVLLSFFFG